MRKKYLRFALAACALLYAVSIGSAALRIALRQTEHKRAATQEFDSLVEKATAAASLGFMDEPFRDAVRQSLEESRSLAAVIVTGPSGPEYAVEREGGYLRNDAGTPVFISRLDVASTPLVAPLSIEAARNATVSAARILLLPEELMAFLRDALLLALVPLLATLLILFLSISEPSRDETTIESNENPIPPPMTKGEGFEEEFDIPEIAPDVSSEVPADGRAEPDVDKLPDIPYADEEEADTLEPEAGSRGPVGLYGPDGALGWEEYLGERLEAELKRAAAFEQDLVLLMAVIDVSDDASFAAFAKKIVEFFSFKDLAFKFGQNGAAVILPNTDIERGLRSAEEFISKFKQGGVNVEIGLSARTGRLVDGSRLLLEAKTAIDRARQEGDFQVLGFKPDPERYRSFVSTGMPR
jgi:hypothetical protein